MWKISKSFQRRKIKKQQYDREPYKNLSEDEKQKLVSIEKNIVECGKMPGYKCKKVF